MLLENQTEVVVTMPIVNPDTGRASRSFTYAGKIDGVERAKIIDYKNTSDPSLYLWRETLSFQPELYALAAQKQFGIVVTEIEYRIVKTPTIRLCGKDANRDAYEQRVFEWLNEKPDGLTTQTLMVSSARLEAARGYLWKCSKRILQNRRDDVWLQNLSACNDFNRECHYKKLCECATNGGNWKDLVEFGEYHYGEYHYADNSHPELGESGKDARILTHSSTRVLTNCEQKFQWMYEHRLRKGEEDLDARWLGNVMHAGLDAFAKEGQVAAFLAIDDWETKNPILGEDAAHNSDQQIARARAMVRAAAVKWMGAGV